MKDYFSGHSSDYARYRPTYPSALFDYLYAQLDHHNTAWDCATGNGQIAVRLSERFANVYATDLSANQLAQAPARPNVTYLVAQAEDNLFNGQQFNLITVGQAIHWFDFDAFYANVNRTLQPDGWLAVLGYGRNTIDKSVDAVVHRLYAEVLDGYWDPARQYIEAAYRTIPFPFEEVATPKFTQTLRWSYDELLGYLNTWSAVKHYAKQRNQNPVDLVADDLRRAWGTSVQKESHFPILLRLGRKP